MKRSELRRTVSLIVAMVLIAMNLSAQIGVNTESPDQSAIVEMKSDQQGLLLPTLTTNQKLAIPNPAHSLLVYDTDLKCVSQNIGTEALPKWTCLSLPTNRKWFYMPSVNIVTTNLGTFTKNLYTDYKNQFTSPMYKSTGAVGSIKSYPLATDLFYYVTHHDPAYITINSISASGVMNYTVNKNANFDTFINIVFVKK